MNAQEAKIQSQKRAADISIETAARERVKLEAITQAEVRRKASFKAELKSSISRYIEFSVQQGGSSLKYYFSPVKNTSIEAGKVISNHKDKAEIDSIMEELKSDGYIVTEEIHCSKYSMQDESSMPDITYYEYQAYISISWGE